MMKGASYDKPIQPRPWREGKTGKPGLRPMEMHPYPRLRRYFPRRGKSSLRSAFVLISISKHSAAKICPSGEDAAEGGRRGAFLSPAGRFACFPSPARAVVWFYHTGAFYKLKGAHQGLCPLSEANTTLGPCDSTGPYAPLRRRRRPPFPHKKAAPKRRFLYFLYIILSSLCRRPV